MIVASVGQYFYGITIFVFSMFLIMLVLVQRGRGGGLAGALGGPGGQSAFGTKAGDLFTRITIVVATIWIFLCASAVFFLKTKKFAPTGGSTVNETMSSGDDSLPPATGGTPSDATTPGLNLDLGGLGTDELSNAGTAELSTMPELGVDAPNAAETPLPGVPATETTETPAAETPAAETPASEASEPESAKPSPAESKTEIPATEIQLESPPAPDLPASDQP
jgi:preprotein translocase subunit SecG